MQNALRILLVSVRADYDIPEMILVRYRSLMKGIEKACDISYVYLQICVTKPGVFYLF